MENNNEDEELLRGLKEGEDLLEKKAKIYARLLIEPSLSETMEGLAIRHAARKKQLEELIGGTEK